jgi:hypothetical protein
VKWRSEADSVGRVVALGASNLTLGFPALVSHARRAWGLCLLPPERRWLFGVEQFTPQTGAALRSGGTVWIY